MELINFILIVGIPCLIGLIVLSILIIRDNLYQRKMAQQKAKSQPWIDKYDSVKSQTHPDVTIISELYSDLRNVQELPNIRMAMITAIKRKYYVQNKTPNSLEQTMTTGQLFDSGNNLWAWAMTLEQLEKIYYIQLFSKKELIRERIQKVFDGEKE